MYIDCKIIINKFFHFSSRNIILAGIVAYTFMFSNFYSFGLVSNVYAEKEGSQSSEYKIKAVYLYNFLKFIEWNGNESQDTLSTFKITIFGDDPFGDAFTPLEKKPVKGKSLQVTRISRIQDLQYCHLLYVCNSEIHLLEQIIKNYGDTGMLIVGETEQFARLGGIVAFFMEDEIVRFAINISAAKRAGIEFSTQLLQLGRIIK